MFSPEDELDVLHQELGQKRRRLESVERAPREGRWTRSDTDWVDVTEMLREEIAGLEREIAGAQANMFAAVSGFGADPLMDEFQQPGPKR